MYSIDSMNISTVVEGKDMVMLLDIPIHTEKGITVNRPDVVIKDKKKNKCIFTDMSVPYERNVKNKKAEKATS